MSRTVGFALRRSMRRPAPGVVVAGAVLTTIAMLASCLAEPVSAHWAREFAPETDLPVAEMRTQMLVFDGQLVLGGAIDQMGGRSFPRVVRWDGSAWQSFGNGPTGVVYGLSTWRGQLLVAGRAFRIGQPPIQGVAAWDGKAWTQVADGLGEADQLAIWNDRVVARGGGELYGKVFLLEENRWVELKGLPDGDGALSLAVSGADLYAGTEKSGVQRWNGTGWVPYGPDPGGAVRRLWSTADGLVAQFPKARGGAPAGPPPRVLASADGAWLPLPAEAEALPEVLGLWHGRVLRSTPDHAILGWDANEWKRIALPFEGSIRTALGDEDRVWLLVERHVSRAVTLNQIICWDGRGWTVLGGGKGVGGEVAAFQADGNRLLVGGAFDRCGLLPASKLAWWDGRQWAAFDTSGDRWVHDTTACRAELIASLAYWQGSLYAGGSMARRRGQYTEGQALARWDGTAWRSVDGMAACQLGGYYKPSTGRSLAVIPAGLAVGGQFCSSGSQVLNGIGLWDGSSLRPLGDASGCPEGDQLCMPEFTKLVPFGPGLVAIGTLRSPDGPRRIGWWNGAAWNFMSDGTDGRVTDMVAWKNLVVAGGTFLRAGDVFTRNIAVWDGDRWSALGDGLAEPVIALGLYRDRVVAATARTSGPVELLSALWTWTGDEWEPFMGGAVFEGQVRTLFEHQGDLYVGGSFGSVNGILSEGIARWIPD